MTASYIITAMTAAPCLVALGTFLPTNLGYGGGKLFGEDNGTTATGWRGKHTNASTSYSSKEVLIGDHLALHRAFEKAIALSRKCMPTREESDDAARIVRGMGERRLN